MARVALYQPGGVQRQGLTDAHLQPADFNTGIGSGIEALGRAASVAIDRNDQIQELHDREQANRLDLEHIEQARILSDRLRETRGVGAREAATSATAELEASSRSLLSQSRSPRARMILEQSVARRTQEEIGRYHAYADDEFVQGYRASSDARMNSAQERVDDIADPVAAREAFEGEAGPVAALKDRASFEGWDGGVEGPQGQAALLRLTTRFHMSRYQSMARAGDPLGARAYLDTHRGEMEDDAYSSATNSVTDSARQQWAKNYIRGDRRTFSEAIGGPAPDAGPATDAAPSPAAPTHSTPAPADPPGHFAIPGGFNIHDGVGARRGNDGRGVHVGMDAMAREGTPFPIGRPFEVLPGSHRQAVVRNGRDGGNIATIRVEGAGTWKAMHLPDLPAAGRYAAGAPVIRSGRSGFRPGSTTESHVHLQPVDAQARAIYAQGRRAVVAALTGGPVAAGDAQASNDNLEVQVADVERDRRLTYADRQAVVAALRSDHAEQRQARAESYDQADRDAATAMLHIGDSFTDVNQLPADIIRRMDPRDIARYQSTARANVDRARARANEEIAPNVLLQYNYTRLANPQLFASPEFRRRLQDMGAPSSIIRNWAAESGQMLGALQHGLRDPVTVANERLWAIARPALEEIGLHFDTVEAGSGRGQSAAREAERRDDARRKNLMLSRLRENVQMWTTAHPGQVPDDALMRGWVGNLVLNANGQRLYEADDQTLFVEIMRSTLGAQISANLARRGAPVTPQNVVAAYRRFTAVEGARRQ